MRVWCYLLLILEVNDVCQFRAGTRAPTSVYTSGATLRIIGE